MSSLVMTTGLTKVFNSGRKVKALKGIDLDIKKGDFISMRGPSGSGKTTLLNIIGCLDSPTKGKVIISGVDTSKMNETELAKLRAAKIGFVFQSFNLMPIYNAVENVELPMENTKLSKKQRREKALKLLDLVGLADRAKHRPSQLSGGEKQRVAIARALANDPVLILADEPTGNLDSKTGKKIIKLLTELNQKTHTTIIMVTHDDAIANLTKRKLYLEDGLIMGRIDDNLVRHLNKELKISKRLLKWIIRAGYDSLEEVRKLDRKKVVGIEGIKDNEVKQIVDKISWYNKKYK